MSRFVEITCAACGTRSPKSAGEINRRLRNGATRFFCNPKCSGRTTNKERSVTAAKNQVVHKSCPQCGGLVVTNASRKATTFCSRKCASAGSVTPLRSERARQTALASKNFLGGATSKGLRSREGWKYVAVEQYLRECGEPFETEFQLEGHEYFFDLALPSRKLLVEFDGPYHRGALQRALDLQKEQAAVAKGWRVARTPAAPMTVIDPQCVRLLLERDDAPPASG